MSLALSLHGTNVTQHGGDDWNAWLHFDGQKKQITKISTYYDKRTNGTYRTPISGWIL